MKFRFKRNKILNTVVAVLLTLLAVGLVAFIGNSVISNLKNDDGYDKLSLSYERGNLTSYGKYEETNYSIYTKESYDLEYGLKAELEFDSTIMYQFFFYDELDNYVGSSEIYEESIELTLEECFNAKRFRVVITPIYDTKLDDDEKIVKWNQVSKYANQLHVKVLTEEIDDGIETITATNYNNSVITSEQITIHDSSHNGLTNKYWYRIYLKQSDTLEGYYIVDTTCPGETSDSTYDLILGCYPSYEDDKVVALFDEICSSEKFSDYWLYIENLNDQGSNLNIPVMIFDSQEIYVDFTNNN